VCPTYLRFALDSGYSFRREYDGSAMIVPRYNGRGVSDASVSADRAEPTGLNSLLKINRRIFF